MDRSLIADGLAPAPRPTNGRRLLMLISASDPVGAALHTALDGLALRQQVTSNHIANVDTPDFTASQVGLEDAPGGALKVPSFSPNDVEASTTPTSDPAGADGNNVDLA